MAKDKLQEGIRKQKAKLIIEAINEGAEFKDAKIQGKPLLHWAAESGNKKLVKALIAKDANINERSSFEGDTPLHLAAYEGHESIVKALKKAGADIDIRSKQGYTPLQMAVLGGKVESVEFLIKAGANVHSIANEGYSIIRSAAQSNNRNMEQIARLLVYGGVDVAGKDKDGKKPLDYFKDDVMRKRLEVYAGIVGNVEKTRVAKLTPVQKAQDALAVNQVAIKEAVNKARGELGISDDKKGVEAIDLISVLKQKGNVVQAKALEGLLKEEAKLVKNLRTVVEKQAKEGAKRSTSAGVALKGKIDKEAAQTQKAKEARQKEADKAKAKQEKVSAAKTKAREKNQASASKKFKEDMQKGQKATDKRIDELASKGGFGGSDKTKEALKGSLSGNGFVKHDSLIKIISGTSEDQKQKMAAYQLLIENGGSYKFAPEARFGAEDVRRATELTLKLADKSVARGNALKDIVTNAMARKDSDVLGSVLKEVKRNEPSKCSDAKINDMMNAVMLVQESKSATKDQKSAADDLVSNMFKEQLSRQKQVDDGKKLGDKAPKNFDVTRMLDVLDHLDLKHRESGVKEMAANLGKSHLTELVIKEQRIGEDEKNQIITAVVDRYSKAGRIGELEINDIMSIVTREYINEKECRDMFEKNASYFAKNQGFMNRMIAQANDGNPLAQNGLKTMIKTLKGKEFDVAFSKVVKELVPSQRYDLMVSDTKVVDKAKMLVTKPDTLKDKGFVMYTFAALEFSKDDDIRKNLVKQLDKNNMITEIAQAYDRYPQVKQMCEDMVINMEFEKGSKITNTFLSNMLEDISVKDASEMIQRYSKAGRIAELDNQNIFEIVSLQYVSTEVSGAMFKKNAAHFAKDTRFMNEMVDLANHGNKLAQNGLKAMMETLKGKEFDEMFIKVAPNLQTAVANKLIIRNQNLNEKVASVMSKKDALSNNDLISKIFNALELELEYPPLGKHIISNMDKHSMYTKVNEVYAIFDRPKPVVQGMLKNMEFKKGSDVPKMILARRLAGSILQKDSIDPMIQKYSKAGRIAELGNDNIISIISSEKVSPEVAREIFAKNEKFFMNDVNFLSAIPDMVNAGNKVATDALKGLLDWLSGKDFNSMFIGAVNTLNKEQLGNLLLDSDIQDKAMKAISTKDFIKNPELVDKVQETCVDIGVLSENVMYALVSALDKSGNYEKLSSMYVEDARRGNAIEYSVINGMIKNQSLSVDAFIKLREKNNHVLKLAGVGDNTKYQKYDFVAGRVNLVSQEEYASRYKRGGEELAAFDRAYEVIKGKDALKNLKEARFEYVKSDDGQEYQTTGDKIAIKAEHAKEDLKEAARSVKGKVNDIIHSKRNSEFEEFIASRDDIWNEGTAPKTKHSQVRAHDPKTQPKPHIVGQAPVQQAQPVAKKTDYSALSAHDLDVAIKGKNTDIESLRYDLDQANKDLSSHREKMAELTESLKHHKVLDSLKDDSDVKKNFEQKILGVVNNTKTFDDLMREIVHAKKDGVDREQFNLDVVDFMGEVRKAHGIGQDISDETKRSAGISTALEKAEADLGEMEKALEAKVAKAPEQPAADLATAVQPTTSVAASTTATADVSKPAPEAANKGGWGAKLGGAIKGLFAAKDKAAEPAHKKIIEKGQQGERGSKAEQVRASEASASDKPKGRT